MGNIKVIDFYNVKKILSKIDNKSLYYDWIKDSFLRKSEFQFPAKISLKQENYNYFNIMPCLWEKENLAMTKVISRHLLEKGEQTRSTMLGDILLYDSKTGILKALIDAEYITTLRTAAVAVHSVLIFGKKKFSKIGLIGLGNIMTEFLDILLSVIDKRQLEIKLYRHKNDTERFLCRFKKNENITFKICDEYEEVIQNSEVIVSAVTNTTKDFAEDKFFMKGVTVIPIMTKGFQNCDLFFDKVFTDEIEQIKTFKYFNNFKSCNNIEDVLNKKVEGRSSNNERIICYNYGIAVHDLYFAKKVYDLSISYSNTKEIDYHYCDTKYFS